MSVLKLLATGKSLVGMKDHGTPYRMRTANLLPKFESAKNPFASKAKPEAAAVSPVSPKVETAAPIAPTAPVIAKTAVMETPSLFNAQAQPNMIAAEEKPAPVQKVEPVVAKPLAVAQPEKIIAPVCEVVAAVQEPTAQPTIAPAPVKIAAPTKRFSIAAWLKPLNPFAFLSFKKVERNVARAKPLKMPVQGELSLERVKVICNDLNETDLEVVPARQEVKAEAVEAKPPVASVPEPVPSGTTFNRLTSRFFGAGHAPVR